MAQKRMQLESAYWHVFNRGARRLGIFCTDAESRTFLELLGEAAQETGVVVHAYCVMCNHFHLIVSGSTDQLSRCMQQVEYRYSLFHNKVHDGRGTNFEGPFKAFPQFSRHTLGQRLVYVLRNPVAAGIASHMGEYAWSSAGAYLGRPGDVLAVDPNPILSHVGKGFDVLVNEYRHPRSFGEERPHIEVAMQQFEWLLLEAERRGLPADFAVYWGRQLGVRPQAMAKVLGEDSHNVRERLYQLRKRAKSDPALRTLLLLP